MELIDKDALVTEIEKLISNGQVKLQESQESNDNESYVAWSEHIATCIKVLSFLDTIEVKEVDLEAELSNYIEHYRNIETGYTLFGIAEHFFKLGLKVKEEDKLNKTIKLADAMYNAAQQLTTDASRLRKAMQDWWNFKNNKL